MPPREGDVADELIDGNAIGPVGGAVRGDDASPDSPRFRRVRLGLRLRSGRLFLAEIIRFRAHVDLTFPPSPIYEIAYPKTDKSPPEMTVNFFGLHGVHHALGRERAPIHDDVRACARS